MYWNILKKDLKRKKTMNLILLLFILLSAMFISGSISNIASITSALDPYFEKAGVTDYLIISMQPDEETKLEEKLTALPETESCSIEQMLYLTPDCILKNGKELPELTQGIAIMPFEEIKLRFFDMNNDLISSVKQGEILLPVKTMKENHLSVGDSMEIHIGDISKTFTISSTFKDALYGSNMMSMYRFVINREDYAFFEDAQNIIKGCTYSINTTDISAIENAIVNEISISATLDRAAIKNSYTMDMVIAGILLIVSVCLILVALVVLRFTISFTLSEEYREIGVMKAIGIRNSKIRMLYMVKYFALAVIGAAIGFFAGIPFGKLLLASVEKNMVIENNNTVLLSLICSAAIVGVILLFCFGCTGKVKKFTPIDAIHSGTTGERFHKKSILRMRKSHTTPAIFMALNDVLSSPKRFGVATLTYTLCLLLVMIIANTANTLRSGEMAYSLSVYESDLYYINSEAQARYFCKDGRTYAQEDLEELEAFFAEQGMPARCTLDIMMKSSASYDGTTFKTFSTQGVGSTADMYRYDEGTPPQNAHEIALSPLTAEKIGAEIGDTITISLLSGEKKFLVTALYQSMMNMGEGLRFHEDADISFEQMRGIMPYQINFDDNPDETEIAARMEALEKILGEDTLQTSGEFVDTIIGVAGTLDSVKMLILAITFVIVALVAILMERSFIAKEQSEIALLKAIGFRTRTIVCWHTMRFVIVVIVSTALAAILNVPLTSLSTGAVFEMMGAAFGIAYKIQPIEIFLIYPLMVFAVTILSVSLTSLYVKSIPASKVSGNE